MPIVSWGEPEFVNNMYKDVGVECMVWIGECQFVIVSYIIVQELRKKGRKKRDRWTIKKEKQNINYL